MDLILWRHADAEEAALGQPDLARKLTARGERQATRVALWLHRQMPDGARILVSPAERAQRTAAKLERKFTTEPRVGPGADVNSLIEVSGWPNAKRAVLIVGHQPNLGQLIAKLLTGKEAPWTIRKGAVWWLRHRINDGESRAETYVLCVQSPETM